MKLIVVQDIKAQAYLTPITVRTIEEGIRLFSNQTKDPQSAFHKNPEDYVLHHVGDYNELNGEIKPCAPHAIATASQLLQ